jgi:hypothetical protein
VKQQASKLHAVGNGEQGGRWINKLGRLESVRWIHCQLGRFLKAKGPTLFTTVSPNSAQAKTMTALQSMLDRLKEDLKEETPPPESPLVFQNPLQTSIAPINKLFDGHDSSSKNSSSSSEEEEEDHDNKPDSPSYSPVENDIIIHRKMRQRKFIGNTDMVVGQIIRMEQLPTHVLASDQVFVTQLNADGRYGK